MGLSRRRARRGRTAKRPRSGKGKLRLHKPVWIDPFPWIQGTSIEKRIIAELVRRRIYFKFQFDIPQEEQAASGVVQPNGFHPDFIIPEYRVILDPFSDFHHTRAHALQRDQVKRFIYAAAGYHAYFPWHTEIMALGASAIVDRIEEFKHAPKFPLKDPLDIVAKRAPGFRLGPHLGLGATGVAAANRSRARRLNPLPKHGGEIRRGRRNLKRRRRR